MAPSSAASEGTAKDTKPERAGTPRSVTSRDLMGGARMLIIRHGEEDYRLQLTTAGKLILTK